MLDEACRLLLDEVSLPGSAPGGKVEFRRTLIVSFLFKFYLEVLQLLAVGVKPPEPAVSLPEEKHAHGLTGLRLAGLDLRHLQEAGWGDSTL